jgi:hypothetical protein
MRTLLILPGLLLVLPAEAAAQPTGDSVAVQQTVSVEAKPRKVCRSYQVTGRRIAQRKCYTAAQWAEYDAVQAEAANKLINDVTRAGAKANLSPDASGGLDTGALFGFGPPRSPTP